MIWLCEIMGSVCIRYRQGRYVAGQMRVCRRGPGYGEALSFSSVCLLGCWVLTRYVGTYLLSLDGVDRDVACSPSIQVTTPQP